MYLPLGETEREAFKAGLGDEAKTQLETWGEVAAGIHNRNKHKFDSPKNLNIMVNPLKA